MSSTIADQSFKYCFSYTILEHLVPLVFQCYLGVSSSAHFLVELCDRNRVKRLKQVILLRADLVHWFNCSTEMFGSLTLQYHLEVHSSVQNELIEILAAGMCGSFIQISNLETK